MRLKVWPACFSGMNKQCSSVLGNCSDRSPALLLAGQFEGRPFRFSCSGQRASTQQKGASKEDKDAWAAASEVAPEEMRAVALKAAQLFEVIIRCTSSPNSDALIW